MATKTITLELDAYERLKGAKTSEKESFSSVVRRAEFPAAPGTGAAILDFLRKGTDFIPSESVLDGLAKTQRTDCANPQMSPDAWVGRE